MLKIKQNKVIGKNSTVKITPSADLYSNKWTKRAVNFKPEFIRPKTPAEVFDSTPMGKYPSKATKKKATPKAEPKKAVQEAPIKAVPEVITPKPEAVKEVPVVKKVPKPEPVKVVKKTTTTTKTTTTVKKVTKEVPAKEHHRTKYVKKVEFVNITKKFGTNVANDDISFSVRENEVHALLGENGAGKSTLMSILFGLYKPTSGQIKINGQVENIKDPRHANELKIAMLPQHFKLVDNMTVLENVILGYEKINKAKGKPFDVLRSLSTKYKLRINLKEKVQDLSISDKQKVEILKILWRDADVIIFDEPTSILTPQEIDNFLKLVKMLQKKGKTILLITHKLPEIKEVAQRVSVIRKGKYITTKYVDKVTEKQMAKLMVGEAVDLNLSSIPRDEIKSKESALEVKLLSYKAMDYEQQLTNISFDIKKGEILGIAAIDGNGQSELIKSIAGLHKITGKVIVDGSDITKHSIKMRYADTTLSKRSKKSDPAYKSGLENFKNQLETATLTVDHHEKDEKVALKTLGKTLSNIVNKPYSAISHIPEDRHKYGLILDYSVRKNSILQDIDFFSTRFGFLKNKDIDFRLDYIKEKYDVRGITSPLIKARALSGGNQQKLIIGREIERASKLLLAVHPTRGLDVGAIRNVYESIIDARNRGMAVLLYSGELDEIMQVSDRIIVMRDGRIVSTSKRGELSKTKIGSLMSGGK